MSNKRLSRVNELLQREIANCLYRLPADTAIDLAKVTITHVITSPDLRKAKILVSCLGSRDEGLDVVRYLTGKRKDLQKMVFSAVVLKYTPHFTFELDESVEKGNRVLDLLDNLPPPSEEAPEVSDDGPKSE